MDGRTSERASGRMTDGRTGQRKESKSSLSVEQVVGLRGRGANSEDAEADFLQLRPLDENPAVEQRRGLLHRIEQLLVVVVLKIRAD